MIHPLGSTLQVRLRFSGPVSDPAGNLYVNGVSGASVSAAADGDLVTASVSTAGVSDGDLIYIAVTGTVGGSSETQYSLTRVAKRMPAVDGNGVVRADDRDGNALLPASGYTAPDNAGISAIKAKTDELPDDTEEMLDQIGQAIGSAATPQNVQEETTEIRETTR